MSGLAALMMGNPPGKQKQNKSKKRRSAAQKRATAKLVAFNRKKHGKRRSKSKSKSKAKKKSSRGGKVLAVNRKSGTAKFLPLKGISLFKRKPSRTKAVRKKTAQKGDKANIAILARGGETAPLPRGKKTMKPYTNRINKRRRHKKNPSAETLRNLGGLAGGALAAAAFHKYALAMFKTGMIAGYLQNRYTNSAVKALVGLAVGMGLPKVVKQKDAQKAARGYMYTSIALALLQAVNFDKVWKLDLSQQGLAGLDEDLETVSGIEQELQGIEQDVSGIEQEMSGIEAEMGLIESEVGAYDDQYEVSGDEYLDDSVGEVGEEYVY